MTKAPETCFSASRVYAPAILSFATSLFLFSSEAHAVPAFARQTGQECAMCHIGSFGPQLTSFGRTFKLNGYTLGEVKSKLDNLSAMVFGGFENTQGALRKGTELSGHQEIFSTNNNLTVDQISIFYGGEIAPHIGALAQATYSGVNDAIAWDNTDIRFADTGSIGSQNFVYGVTANNNPSVQDLWQTTPAWQFPYVSSGLVPTPSASPFMNGLGQQVAGVGVYSMWNDMLYAEISGYHTLGDDIQQTLGETGVDGNDHLKGVAPYWRLALQHDFGPHYVSIGTFGMDANNIPGNQEGIGKDNYLDEALDATYQFHTDDNKHSVSVYGVALHERQNLNATFANLASANSKDTLTSLRANASYYYSNTYGITLSRFDLTGSADSGLYSSPNNRPDSSGWTTQLDFTPFGTNKDWGYPSLNARFFVQYTVYDKFNGTSTNYDNTGRNASDNNTLYTGVWFAF